MQTYLKALFVLVVLLNTAFVKLSVGLPIKDLMLFGLFVLLLLTYNLQAATFLQQYHSIFLVFFAFTALGFAITLLNGRNFGGAFISSLRIMVQPMLIMTCTYLMASIAGLRFTATVFIGSAILTGFVAILQFLDVDQAWQLRALLGRLQAEPSDVQSIVQREARPLGISLTPIMYSYHLASAYVLGNLLYRRGLMQPKHYYVFVGVMLAMTIANGTRSLLAGIVLHEIVSNVLTLGRRSVMTLGILAIGGLVTMSVLEAISSRVSSLSDASAVGRVVLFEYGMHLAADHPFGLGWGFDPGDVAWLYWEELAGLGRADVVFSLALHNAYLNFFLMYGVFGVLILIVIAVAAPRRLLEIAVFSLAYLFHATFHNDGIFLGDDYYWFAFAMFLRVGEMRPSTIYHDAAMPSMQSWRGAGSRRTPTQPGAQGLC